MLMNAYDAFFRNSPLSGSITHLPLLSLSRSRRIGGTLGAVVTCPLEVVKTRQQSSLKSFDYYHQPSASKKPQRNVVVQIFRSLRHIARNEGKRGLFRGLGANLVGVAPSRFAPV